MESFIQRYGPAITGVLHGGDRLVIRGTLRALMSGPRMARFLWRVGVKLTDFGEAAQGWGERIKQAAAQEAEAAGRPQRYLASATIRKDELARQIAPQDRVDQGLVAVLTCVEPCLAYQLHRNAQTRRLDLQMRPRKCLHVYRYLVHPQWGFMHLRLQTWLPFQVQVYLNGREWLARQLDAAGIGYQRRDNCLVAVQDPPAAQRLLDAQLHSDLCGALEQLARRCNPVYPQLFASEGLRYYWSVHQSECGPWRLGTRRCWRRSAAGSSRCAGCAIATW